MDRLKLARMVFLVVVSALGLFVVYLILKRPEPAGPVMTITLQPRPTLDPVTPTPAPINVYVSGAVKQPDVYTLPLGSLVKDAIAAAGGAAADADLDHINLALRLSDQQQVHVPRRGEAPPVNTNTRSGVGAIGALININTATLEELDTLPGIGPSIAQAIIDYRTAHGPFQTIEEIDNVKGIGPALFEKIKSQITVGP
jgi:competence protein ComEA